MLGAWLGGWIVAVWARKWCAESSPAAAWWPLAAMVAVSLILRTLLTATLSATGIELMHRYCFPAATLLVIAGMLGLSSLVSALRPASRPG
jgi:hypothetical protein